MAFTGWGKARGLLVLAALVDALGLVGLFVVSAWTRDALVTLPDQGSLMTVLVLSYCTLGWLFGSYTLLKLQRVRWSQVLLRLGATSAGSMLVAALLEWSGRVSPEVTLLHRGNVIPAFALAAIWSGAWRWLLRRLPEGLSATRWLVVAQPNELTDLTKEWFRGPSSSPKPNVVAQTMVPTQLDAAAGLAITAGIAADQNLQTLCEQVVSEGLPVITLVELAEQELQRIPPRWIGAQWLMFSSRIEGLRSHPNQQLKRYADVVVSLMLLVLSSPIWLLSALLIRLHDGGPVLYRQTRTGLLGRTFAVIKLRTMVPDAEQGRAQWAQLGDRRITPVGVWLRRTRIDELPQLLNVLRGEMSLIGPRPERPELETALEAQIPNYRLRHWIRPGLSGWAQVNMPYSSSMEDAELKLSYDLFYLRNASAWLDILILMKTIKTILKAAGR
jgi:exopolysaccharide biosynthesis polyprenyl glycosylphosphotransferase